MWNWFKLNKTGINVCSCHLHKKTLWELKGLEELALNIHECFSSLPEGKTFALHKFLYTQPPSIIVVGRRYSDSASFVVAVFIINVFSAVSHRLVLLWWRPRPLLSFGIAKRHRQEYRYHQKPNHHRSCRIKNVFEKKTHWDSNHVESLQSGTFSSRNFEVWPGIPCQQRLKMFS